MKLDDPTRQAEAHTRRKQRVVDLVRTQYDAALIDEALGRILDAVQPSGIDGSHAACLRLHKIRRALRKIVRDLDGPITDAVRRFEAE